MVELKECNKKCFCKDCDDEECLHAGKREADCPRYICVFQNYQKEFLDCENCLWLSGYYAETHKGEWIDDHGSDVCSACGFSCDDTYYLGEANFCPNCGCDMRGEKYD